MSTTDTGTGTTQDARTAAADAAANAQDAAKDAAGQAQEKIQEAAGQAKEQAAQAGQQAKDRVRGQVDERSTEFGHRATGTADDLRSVSEQLRAQGKHQPAQLADQLADRADQAGRYLKDSDADRLLHDLEDFGRQRPWAVIAGGLAVGFVASRFLKSTSADRYRGTQSGAGQAAGPDVQRSPTGFTGAPPTPLGSSVPGGGTTPPPIPTPVSPTPVTASPVSPPEGRSVGGYTTTTASAPQPDIHEAPVPLDDVPIATGPNPLTTTNRERENGTASNGDL